MTYTTSVQITPEMRESARVIYETACAMHKGKATVMDFRAANRASREKHGDDLHEIVKGLALSGMST